MTDSNNWRKVAREKKQEPKLKKEEDDCPYCGKPFELDENGREKPGHGLCGIA